MSSTCHACGGSGWQVGSAGVCTPCDGTGRPDGQLSPHQVLVMAEMNRAKAHREQAHRVSMSLLAGVAALTAAAAAVLNIAMCGGW